jgi:hypothetical protein
MKKYVESVMKGCIERTSSAQKCKITYLYVLFNEDRYGI